MTLYGIKDEQRNIDVALQPLASETARQRVVIVRGNYTPKQKLIDFNYHFINFGLVLCF